jgi:hypothetical protein
MAASRSTLEALLARVQKRANEPRQSSVEVVRSSGGAALSGAALSGGKAGANARAAAALDAMRPARDDAEEDIEEYDEELIEIIDDAEVIPQAAAAARAIEPGAFGASLDRRSTSAVGARPAAPSPAAPSPAFGRPAAARPAPVEALRPEAVSPRPIAATEIARSQGKRRDLRSTSFLELLDASLGLGS